jgi:hypothetical protein
VLIIDALTDAERNITIMGFQSVYNKLQAENVCDSLQRLVLNVSQPTVKQVDESVADPSKGEFVLSYEITSSCRGCPEPVLFEDSINRDQSTGRVLGFGETELYRELATTCTCPAGVEDRGLVEDDFVNAYQNWIDEKMAVDELENLSGLLSLSETGTFTADTSSAFVVGHQTSTYSALQCLIVLWVMKKLIY